MDNKINAEDLHDVAKDTSKAVSDKFVNPGTPEAPLVSRENMSQATLNGGTEQLRKRIIK